MLDIPTLANDCRVIIQRADHAGVAVDAGNVIDLLADNVTGASLDELRAALDAAGYGDRFQTKPTGRSIRADVRNPLLSLPSARALQSLPPEAQAAIRALCKDISADARARAEKCWRTHKAPMAAYWKAVAVYANHTARLFNQAKAPTSEREANAQAIAALPLILSTLHIVANCTTDPEATRNAPKEFALKRLAEVRRACLAALEAAKVKP